MTVYADNAATTKMSQTALNAMLPAMEENFGNPSSLHSVGQRLTGNQKMCKLNMVLTTRKKDE